MTSTYTIYRRDKKHRLLPAMEPKNVVATRP